MAKQSGAQVIQQWPEASREAAQLVLDQHGEPDEITESQLVWYGRKPWKRIIASKVYYDHHFPTQHTDSVETVIDYHVPPDKFNALAEFDGSVIVERTAGEVSARCHDEQANMLALNLMHDIVTGKKSAAEARSYYAKEFLDYRRKKPTPYMDKLHFSVDNPDTGDPDEALLSAAQLQAAVEEGKGQRP